MSKTPVKSDSIHQFKPIEITSPHKDQQEISKTVYSHVSIIHSLVTDWLRMKDRGVRSLKTLTALKLHECVDDYYPLELKGITEALLGIIDNLKVILDGFTKLSKQLQALAQLQPTNEPVISTWSVGQISGSVTDILASLEKEFMLKHIIVENVAHCRDECLQEVYVTAWNEEVYLNFDLLAYLFVEVGLPAVP